MTDSLSVVVGGEVAAGLADVLVVPEAGGEGEQALSDAGHEAGHRDGAVVLDGELAFEGVEHGLDPLADRAERPETRGLVFAVRAHEDRAELVHELFEVAAGEAFVGDHGLAVELDAGEHLGGDLALAEVRGGQFERDRHPVSGAEQVEAKAPEVAGVAGAVAVGAWPGNSDRLTVSRDCPDGTGVESSRRMSSNHESDR